MNALAAGGSSRADDLPVDEAGALSVKAISARRCPDSEDTEASFAPTELRSVDAISSANVWLARAVKDPLAALVQSVADRKENRRSIVNKYGQGIGLQPSFGPLFPRRNTSYLRQFQSSDPS